MSIIVPKVLRFLLFLLEFIPLNYKELTFEHPVWRILTDAGHDIIAFETRSHEFRSVTFSAAEFSSGKIWWREKAMEESWETGLEEVCHEIVFIHGYKKQGSPEHKGISALDAKTGKLLWENKEWAFYRKTFDRIICFNPLQEPGRFFYVEPGTGIMRSEIVSEPEMKHEISVLLNHTNDKLQFPVLIKEDPENKDWNHWRDYIKSLLNINAVGCMEGMKITNHRIFSYYETGNGKLNNYILICDLNGNMLMNELMAENVNGYGTDTFFNISGKVCYVREKRIFRMVGF